MSRRIIDNENYYFNSVIKNRYCFRELGISMLAKSRSNTVTSSS